MQNLFPFVTALVVFASLSPHSVRAEFDPELFKKTETLVMQDKDIQNISQQITEVEKSLAELITQLSTARAFNVALRTLIAPYTVSPEVIAKHSKPTAELEAQSQTLTEQVAKLKKDRTLAVWQKMELIEPSLKPFIAELRQTAAP